MYTVHVSTFEIVVGISELEKRLQWISFVYKNTEFMGLFL